MTTDQTGRRGSVVAVARSSTHSFSKQTSGSINLIAGLGIEGDAHRGTTVQHRSRVKADPTQPNLRQVHLIHQELLETLRSQGFRVGPGRLGENITTTAINLLDLPRGTRLHIGPAAVVEITGLRNPCRQLDEYQPGLMDAVLERTASGALILKAGIMGIVIAGGRVSTNDSIEIALPERPHEPLARV